MVIGWAGKQGGALVSHHPLPPKHTHSPLVPRPLLLEVRNIAHDSAAEYRAYRGGYAPALLPLSDDDSHGKGGAGAAAVGAPM